MSSYRTAHTSATRERRDRAVQPPKKCVTFTVRLEAKPPGEIRRLRWILKRLAHDYGLICTDLRETRTRR
jgi:hypothetical protein